MPNTTDIIRSFREKVSAEVELESEGLDRFIVYTPFMFDDGDHFVVILKRIGDHWLLTDEGHTFMHMEYSGVDFSAGTRLKLIEGALAAQNVEARDGSLILQVPNCDFGDALFSFLQCLSQISNVTKITREVAKSTFIQDLAQIIKKVVPEHQIIEHWYADFDKDKKYEVDFCIFPNGKPWFFFGINNDSKCNEATISCYYFEKKYLEKKLRFESVAVFENQASIGRNPVARLSDVVGKQFSSLSDTSRINDYLRQTVLHSDRI